MSLKGIPPVFCSPELIGALCELGHRDSIVIADKGFPARRVCQNVISVSVGVDVILDAILMVRSLDFLRYTPHPAIMMKVSVADRRNKELVDVYQRSKERKQAIIKHSGDLRTNIDCIEPKEFYEAAKQVRFVVQCLTDSTPYGNLLLTFSPSD